MDLIGKNIAYLYLQIKNFQILSEQMQSGRKIIKAGGMQRKVHGQLDVKRQMFNDEEKYNNHPEISMEVIRVFAR